MEDRELAYALERAKILEELISSELEKRSVACHEGCPYCCYGVTLWITRAEALLISYYLNSLPLKKRKELYKRLKDYAKAYRKEARNFSLMEEGPVHKEELDTEALGKISALGLKDVPCPFLNAKALSCEIYPARPDMCRFTVYSDDKVCKQDWEDPLRFLWRDKILPFIEEVKESLSPKLNLRLTMLRSRYGDLDLFSLEETVAFITRWIRFDPVRKSFRC